MSHPIKDKYIEPMVKGEKSHHHSRKRDSGYGGTASDRSSHRHSSSRKSNESTNGSSRGYAEPDIASQNFNMSALQNALQAANESKERLDKLNYNLDQALTDSNKENKRLRRERDAERTQNDQLRANLASANKENERLRKDLKSSKYQQRESGGKDSSRKGSSKSSSSKDTTWKEMPVPLYRAQTPPPEVPEPRNARPPSSSSRPTGQRRMSMSHAPAAYTYTVTPANYSQY